jgi:hypothetical protein
MEKLDEQSLTASDRGLRHGLLIERFGIDVVEMTEGKRHGPERAHP